MKTIEEQLWDYIDGNCTTTEIVFIKAKIADNKTYKAVYEELLLVHEKLNDIALDEPSMSFTRNVMEQVQLEIKPIALKTKVDQRIIYSIAAFFVFSMVAIFGYTLAKSDLSLNFSLPQLNFDYNNSTMQTLFKNPILISSFLMIDVVLVLLYLDSYLRRKKDMIQKKEV